VSVDSVWTHQAFAKQMGLAYPLLADFQPRGEVAKKYGLFLDEKGFTARATVIVDRAGKVAWVKQEEVPQPRSNQKILEELRKLS
jgi:peroxiredoxin